MTPLNKIPGAATECGGSNWKVSISIVFSATSWCSRLLVELENVSRVSTRDRGCQYYHICLKLQFVLSNAKGHNLFL